MLDNSQRSVLVLYTTAVCNLNCTYCYIDKNPALVNIDNLLDESFQGDYYFNFSKKLFDKEILTEVQFWGGEPMLRFDRCFETVKKMIEYYPNLHRFMMSTNFTGDNWFEQFYGFLNILREYPNKQFEFHLQLSIDGPQYINDVNRGNGVTEKFTQHFSELVATIGDNLPKNVKLLSFFKPTYDSGTIRKLQKKEDIISYFQFFEEFKQIAQYAELEDGVQFYFNLPIPNTACPSPHTKEDGLLFANYCRLTREIERENRNGANYFKFYTQITSFTPRHPVDYIFASYQNGGTCGTGVRVAGLLPGEHVSVCHNGFVDLISDYKKMCNEQMHSENRTIDFLLFSENQDSRNMNMNLTDFEMYEKQMKCYDAPHSCFQTANLTAQIKMLARFNQIDEKYNDPDEALRGAIFIHASTSYCMRDNIGVTGTCVAYPLGLIKLLLNGAREYIEEV